jgi:predicted nucleotidyltransferase
MSELISTDPAAVEQLQPVVTALQQALGDNLIALVLFGSRARGDAQPESDWDLLLIAEGLPVRTFARHLSLKASLPPDWRGQISLLAKTTAEFETALPSLFLDIAVDGVILYDKEGYAQNRLRHLKRLIEAKGLYRQQQGRNLTWHWRNFPGLDWQLAWEERG